MTWKSDWDWFPQPITQHVSHRDYEAHKWDVS